MHGVVDEEVAALAGRQLMRVPGAVQLLWRVRGQSEPGPVTAGIGDGRDSQPYS